MALVITIHKDELIRIGEITIAASRKPNGTGVRVAIEAPRSYQIEKIKRGEAEIKTEQPTGIEPTR